MRAADVDAPPAPALKRIYTIDDVEWLDRLPENRNRQWELVESKVVTRHWLGFWSGAWLSNVAFELYGFVKQTDAGIALLRCGWYTPDDRTTLLVPRVAFASHERLPADRNRNDYPPIMPDLAIEMQSHLDSDDWLRRKARLFLERGTEIVWLIYPDSKEAEVCALDAAGDMTREVIGADGELSGADVLPGFTLPLSRLFS